MPQRQSSMLPKFEEPAIAKLRFLYQRDKLNITRVAADLGVVEATIWNWLKAGRGSKNQLIRNKLDEILAAADAA